MSRNRCGRCRAVDRGGLENVGRQRLQAREQDQRHERRPFPGVDRDQAWRARAEGRRAGRADRRGRVSAKAIAEHAVFRTEQRLEDEPDDERRDGRGNEQEPERDRG